MQAKLMAISGQVRHLLSGLGGLLVGLGWSSQEEIGELLAQFESAVGGILLFGAMAWSLWEKALAKRHGVE